MLPMPAYGGAYVHFFVFLVACLCAYVLFLGLPFWEESWVSSQTLGKNITLNRARCGEGQREARHSARQTKMDTSGAEVQLTLAPEWSI